MKVWRGRVGASGAWLLPDFCAGPRLLQLWLDGHTNYYVGDWGALLFWDTTRWVDCLHFPAVPLVVVGQGHSSFAGATPAAGEVHLFWQGRLHRLAQDELKVGDMGALWSDPPGRVIWGQSLRPPQRVSPKIETGPVTDTIHQALPSVVMPAPARSDMLRRMQTPRPEKLNPLMGFFELLRSQFGHDENRKYLENLIRMFQENRLQEALRHAIPMGDPACSESLSDFVDRFQPRSGLDYTPRGGYASAWRTGESGSQFLQSLYEKALLSLLESKQFEEAAFCCSELLGRHGQAVAILEGAQLYLQAARLAELKGLSWEIQVRLWFMAGEVAKAMELARRGWCHASVLAHLQRESRHQHGPAFQAAWARDLVAAGRLVEGLRIGSEVRQLLPEWESWLLECLSPEKPIMAEPGTIEILCLGLADPQLSQKHALIEIAAHWIEQEDLGSYATRRLLIEALAKAKLRPSMRLKELAQPLVRRILRQANGPFPLGDGKILDSWMTHADDPWLAADLPTICLATPKLRDWRASVPERGRLEIWDALLLPDGRLLLGLGHGGALVLSRQGKVAQRFSFACHHWVGPERGHLYLALGECDDVDSLTRLQAHNYQHQPWCQVALQSWNEVHDGFLWPVIQQEKLFLVDVRASDWRSPQKLVVEECSGVHARKDRLILFRGDSLCRYDYPGMRYRSSEPLRRDCHLMALSQDSLITVKLEFRDDELCYGYSYASHNQSLPGCRAMQLQANSSWAALSGQTAQGRLIHVFPLKGSPRTYHLELPDSTRSRARLCGDTLVVCDNLGRLLLLDLRAGQWLHQFFL